MFTRIAVPLDGSKRAERAVPVALRLAEASAGIVMLFEVMPPAIVYGAYTPNEVIEQAFMSAAVATSNYLSEVAQRYQSTGVEIQTAVLEGVPASTILDFARWQQVDLIIISSKGHTGLTRWMLGSVAHEVVRESPAPVLLLREEETEQAGFYEQAVTGPLQALVYLDDTRFSEAVLLRAVDLVGGLAIPGQGILHPFATARPNRREPGMQETEAYLETVAETLRQGAAAQFNLQVRWSVVVGEDVAGSIIRMAEQGAGTPESIGKPFNLIAMATHGRGCFKRLRLGSVMESVLEGTRLPVLTVKPG